jgi:hypothetical protein
MFEFEVSTGNCITCKDAAMFIIIRIFKEIYMIKFYVLIEFRMPSNDIIFVFFSPLIFTEIYVYYDLFNLF